jgi:hypothetical protein
MDNTETLPRERDARGRLTVGHKKLPGAGRPVGRRNWSVRAIAEQLDVNPFFIALEILKSQHLPLLPGEKAAQRKRVSPELYVKLLIEMSGFLAPKLAATQITGSEGAPLAVATLDVTQLMSNPELARAAQLLALGMARPQIEAGSSAPDGSGGHAFLYEDDPPAHR